MKSVWRSIFALLSLTWACSIAYASAPTCNSTPSPYCAYTGTVKKVYVNNANSILFYFDTNLDLTLPSSVGISGVTKANAGIVSMNDNVEFAKAIFAVMLTAQARGVPVTIQLRGAQSGYLKIDRIWMEE